MASVKSKIVSVYSNTMSAIPISHLDRLPRHINKLGQYCLLMSTLAMDARMTHC